MSVEQHSDRGLMELNRRIREVSREIRKLHFDRSILQQLVADFSRLAFDKLVLDLACSKEVSGVAISGFDSHVSRVILGRTRAAMKFFDPATAPLKTVRAKEHTRLKLIEKLRRASVYLSRASAERRLNELKEEYGALRDNSDGLGEVIKRLKEDNTVLQLDIDAVRGQDTAAPKAQAKEQTWLRLAEVDLFCTPSAQLRATVASQRRMSALSQRRMSVSSTRPRSEIGDSQGPASIWSEFPSYEFPRAELAQPAPSKSELPPIPQAQANPEARMSLVSARRRSGAAYSDLSSFGPMGFGSLGSVQTVGSTGSGASTGSLGSAPGSSVGLTDTSISDSVSISTRSRPRSMIAAERYKAYNQFLQSRAERTGFQLEHAPYRHSSVDLVLAKPANTPIE